MTVKELVLTSLESFENFKIQYTYYQGKVKELTMTKELYLQVADKEVDSYYLDIDKETNQPYISLKLF